MLYMLRPKPHLIIHNFEYRFQLIKNLNLMQNHFANILRGGRVVKDFPLTLEGVMKKLNKPYQKWSKTGQKHSRGRGGVNNFFLFFSPIIGLTMIAMLRGGSGFGVEIKTQSFMT